MEGGDRGAQREALRIEEQLREIRAAQDQIADRIRRAERDGSGSGPDLAGLRAMEAALSRLARQTGENEKAIESIAAEAATANRSLTRSSMTASPMWPGIFNRR